MASIQFKRGLAADIPAQIVEGCFYYATDTGEFYLDMNSTRTLINPKANWNATSGNAAIINKPVLNNAVISATQPTTGSAGDLWLVLEN